MWGILLNEYDKCTLYDVETKLSQDFCVDNEIGLMKYMAGATGILKGLKVQSYFKLFC